MLSDGGHQVGEIDRRIKVEGRIHELSTKLVRELARDARYVLIGCHGLPGFYA